MNEREATKFRLKYGTEPAIKIINYKFSAGEFKEFVESNHKALAYLLTKECELSWDDYANRVKIHYQGDSFHIGTDGASVGTTTPQLYYSLKILNSTSPS